MSKLIEGVTVVLGGDDYIVPPLNIKGLRKLGPKLKGLEGLGSSGIPTDQEYDLIVEVVELALRRNYPDLSRETLEDIIDMRNMYEVLGAVMAASGLTKGEVAAVGEA